MADELIDSDETMAGPAAEETSAAIAPMTETVAADLAWGAALAALVATPLAVVASGGLASRGRGPQLPVCSINASRPPYPISRKSLSANVSRKAGGCARIRSSSSAARVSYESSTIPPIASLGDTSSEATLANGSSVCFSLLRFRNS